MCLSLASPPQIILACLAVGTMPSKKFRNRGQRRRKRPAGSTFPIENKLETMGLAAHSSEILCGNQSLALMRCRFFESYCCSSLACRSAPLAASRGVEQFRRGFRSQVSATVAFATQMLPGQLVCSFLRISGPTNRACSSSEQPRRQINFAYVQVRYDVCLVRQKLLKEGRARPCQYVVYEDEY
jgi:hypothetical protein